MNQVVTVEIPVDAEAAEALSDSASRARIGKLISRIAPLFHGTDPLASILERTSRRAQDAGLTDQEIDAELAAYNAERRS
ncbi:MAG TPA: hypothetical protein VFW75_13775 [Acetobacteraceae bacterium]|nr:hypothetical protein [Acetobacteraceae bacterium]